MGKKKEFYSEAKHAWFARWHSIDRYTQYRAAQDAAVGRKIPDRASKSVTSGAFHSVKISGISGSAVKGTRFVGSSHWNIPRNSGKSKKVGPFSRLEFPNGMSCSIYVSCSLYQFQVHGRAPRRTGVYDQMEQLFTNPKFHFCSHRNFRVFFLNGKRPQWPWMRILTSRLKSGSLDGLDVSMDGLDILFFLTPLIFSP